MEIPRRTYPFGNRSAPSRLALVMLPRRPGTIEVLPLETPVAFRSTEPEIQCHEGPELLAEVGERHPKQRTRRAGLDACAEDRQPCTERGVLFDLPGGFGQLLRQIEDGGQTSEDHEELSSHV